MTLAENHFSNEEVVVSDLPQLDTLQTVPLSIKYAPINRVLVVAFCMVLCALSLILYSQPWFTMHPFYIQYYYLFLAAIIGLSLLDFIYVFLADPKKRYAVREHDLNFSSGLIFRKTVSQPLIRIQHVELKRGPIERWAKLATLQVFSAGGAAHTFEIPGLDIEVAQKLREQLLQYTRTRL